MKIYFDGCSITHGKGYLGDEYKDVRWSKLLCDKLGAEEYNFALCGGCNQRILRNISIENSIEEYDLAIIQLTIASRTEFYHQNKFSQVNPRFASDRKEFNKTHRWGSALSWQMYYRNIYHEHYGDTVEHMVYNCVKSICKLHGIPLILLSCYSHTKMNYDLIINGKTYTPVSDTDSHPSKESQKLIARDVYNIWMAR
jgi:hypothetical protein